MRLLDPRNGEDHDLPSFAGTRRVYVIASLPRTGSTLLCRALWETGRVGAPKEYLNPMQLRDWELRLGSRSSRLRHRALRGPLLGLVGMGGWTPPRVAGHLQRVMARRTGPSGWFGLKLHRHHQARWLPDPEAVLGPHIRWILVDREDELAQAVSWYRALQTGQWASHQRPWMRPIYSRRAIGRRMRQIRALRAGWETWMDRRGIEPLRVRYEDLAADLGGEVRRVLAHLEVEAPDRVVAPGMQRQADPVSAAWVERFRAGR